MKTDRKPAPIQVFEFCDHCAAEVTPDTRCIVASLTVPVASANEGESATLCRKCHATHAAGGTLLANRDPITGAEYGSLT